MNSPASGRQRAYWLKTLHHWHWISSALCLVGMLLFSITGITLNHAASIEASPRVENRTGQLPAGLARALVAAVDARQLPDDLRTWTREQLAIEIAGRETEWADDEVVVALPRPGGDAWLRIGLPDGDYEYEKTDRGWIAYLNDLHKGRHTGAVWYWFIDVFAVATLVFSITGLLILKMHAANRPSTWPITAAGLLLPLLIALLFIH